MIWSLGKICSADALQNMPVESSHMTDFETQLGGLVSCSATEMLHILF